jgi:osmotically inducible lipoprotein OsmB
MRPKLAIIAMATTLAVAGCANMTTTEQRMLSGAAIGALGGVAIAAIAETNIATGAAIGAGVGTGAGYLYSRSRNEQQAAYHPAKHQHVARAAKPKPPTSVPAPARDQLLASD